MKSIEEFRDFLATPLPPHPFSERFYLYIKITFLIGLTCSVVLQFKDDFSFSFGLFYAWAVVAVSFGMAQWILEEGYLFLLRKQGKGELPRKLGVEWLMTFFNFLVGYGIFLGLSDFLIPLVYPEYGFIIQGIRTWELFFRILPLWFFISFLLYQLEAKKVLASNLEQAQSINRLLEQKNREFAPTPKTPESYSSSHQELPKFTISRNNETEVLNPETISHISVEEHYSRIFVKTAQALEEIEVRLSLKDALKKLPADSFIQIHRSHVINLAHVSHIQQNARSYQIFMGNQKAMLPISRHRVPQVLPVLQEFLNPP